MRWKRHRRPVAYGNPHHDRAGGVPRREPRSRFPGQAEPVWRHRPTRRSPADWEKTSLDGKKVSG